MFLSCATRHRTVLGRHRRPHRCLLLMKILEKQVFHLHFSQRGWNSVDADFYSRSQALSLEVVLCAQSSCSFSNYIISKVRNTSSIEHTPSSCRFSIKACFWCNVMPACLFLIGLRSVGVVGSSLTGTLTPRCRDEAVDWSEPRFFDFAGAISSTLSLSRYCCGRKTTNMEMQCRWWCWMLVAHRAL